ncbi:MAG: hypothetical protein IPP27_02350 [Bacteroidetes bacterium]|nr:hypothetical protein [Bacteroidota bacterium]
MKSAFIALTIILTWFNGKGQLDSSVTLLSVIDTYKEGHTNGKSELVQKAVKDCKTLISIFEKNNDIKNLAKAKTLFGQILVENGNYPLAKVYLQMLLISPIKYLAPIQMRKFKCEKISFVVIWLYG